MLVSPNIERRRRKLIDQWNRKPQFCPVHTFNVVLAGIAGLDSNMVEFGCVKITEFCRTFFVTINAGDTSERPVDRTGSADKVPVATLRCWFSDLKKTHLRHAAAEWTSPFV